MTIKLDKLPLNRFRLSFIWTATVLGEHAPTTTPFVERLAYETYFDELQKSGADKFACPWDAYRFWTHYLGVTNPTLVKGSIAWDKAVPLRGERTVSVSAKAFPGALRAEQYFLPFGMSLVVTLDVGDDLTKKKMNTAKKVINRVIEMWHDSVAVTFKNETPRVMKFKGLGNEYFARMLPVFYGPNASMSATQDPFTVLTVLSVDNWDLNVAPKQGDPLHRLLFAAATLDQSWETAKLENTPLDKAALALRRASGQGDVVFATKRGRAIWNSSSFTKAERTTSQSCYHRNQMYAAMQVESLCGLASALNRRTKANPTLPQQFDQFGIIAADLLANLHAGTDTYRSMSVQRQVNDNGMLPIIADLRRRYGLAPWLPA